MVKVPGTNELYSMLRSWRFNFNAGLLSTSLRETMAACAGNEAAAILFSPGSPNTCAGAAGFFVFVLAAGERLTKTSANCGTFRLFVAWTFSVEISVFGVVITGVGVSAGRCSGGVEDVGESKRAEDKRCTPERAPTPL